MYGEKQESTGYTNSLSVVCMPARLQNHNQGTDVQVFEVSDFFFSDYITRRNRTSLHGTLECGAKLWSAEKTLAGQRQRMDVLSLARSAHDGLFERDVTRISAELSLCPSDDPIGQGTELN